MIRLCECARLHCPGATPNRSPRSPRIYMTPHRPTHISGRKTTSLATWASVIRHCVRNPKKLAVSLPATKPKKSTLTARKQQQLSHSHTTPALRRRHHFTSIRVHLADFSSLSETGVSQSPIMSFGVGVGDLVAISQLAFKLYSNFENFEGSIARASDTFTSVFLALTLLECEELVFSNVQGTFHNDRLLERAVSNCGTTLEELMGILERHNLSTVERFHRPKYQSNIFLSDVERAWKDPVSYTSELRAWILMCGSPFISNEYEANPPALMRESQLPDPGESLWTTHHGRGQRSRTACVSAPNRSQCCTLGAETLSDRTITILPAIDCALTPFVYARKSIVSSDDALRQLHLEDGHLRQLQLKSSQRRVSNRTLASHQADHPPRGPASFVSTIHRLCIRKTLSFHSPTLLTLLYPLLFVSSASAMDHGSPMIQAHLQLETQDHISWLQALHSSQKELLSVSLPLIHIV